MNQTETFLDNPNFLEVIGMSGEEQHSKVY